MKISIRWTLILGFLGLIWATQLIITSSTYISSKKVLSGHARDIMQNIADLTMVQSKNHLALAQGAAQLTKRLMTSRVFGSDENQLLVLEKYFLDQLAIYPHFAGIYMGKPNGDFFYVNRSDDKTPRGFRTKIILHLHGERTTQLIWRDAGGQMIQENVDPQDSFDPRQRPWFQKVVAEKAITWTDPYIFFTSQKPGITIAGPILDGDELKAVVGVDIDIDQLSLFISQLRIGKHGHAFMFNNNGDVLAFPDPAKLKHRDDTASGKARLAKIDELDDEISKAAFHCLSWQHDEQGRLRLAAPAFGRFIYDGEAYLAMFTPFQNTQWPWMIGVYLPEKDYLGGIHANQHFNFVITLLLSGLATLIGLRLARGIIRPLAGLEKEALAIKQNDLSRQYDIRSAYKEIQETADSFARMKESLKSGEEKYRSIFENIQDVYYETSVDGRILEISPSVQKISAFTREDLVGTNFEQRYYDPLARRRFMEIITREDKVNDYEIELFNKDGTRNYCAISAVLKRDADGQPLKIIGSLRVINDRKRAEMELRRYQEKLEALVTDRTRDLEQSNQQLRLEVEARKEKEAQLRISEERYRSIIENMDSGYYEMNLTGHLTFFNDRLVQLLGYTKEELLGKHFRECVVPDLVPILELKFKAILRTGLPAKLSRYNALRKDGKIKSVEATVTLLTGPDGEPTGFRGVVLDISDRLSAEEEKKKLEERFQQIQRLEGIATLAGGVAHDFNNLLMGIQGNVSLMLLDAPPESSHRDKLKSIESCVAAGADLTRQLLGFARGGKYMVKPLDLNHVTQRAAGMFGRTRKEIKIVQKLQSDLWTVMADANQIQQVLLNIYINAWQAMPNGGHIYIETKNCVLDEAFVRPFDIPAGRYVCISVADVGLGMEVEVQKRIFEPFFTTKEVGRGTGLGLASAYGIIKNHGGAIDFVSQVGEGTTFYIYLPGSDAKPLAERERHTMIVRGSGTILLVDDERRILTVSQSMLERLGYTVLPAEGGLPALEIFEQFKDRIDLVVLDMIMPDLSGSAVFDHLRDMRPDVKVLLCSGYSLTQQAEDMLARGCAGFIQKPFNMERLSQKIKEILKG
ncbi:MAG: PAS domain S-box protein [Desulfobacteraceae bacterium]|nr:PAS domain S-box protein [Desulfobacteraceae bacterium]